MQTNAYLRGRESDQLLARAGAAQESAAYADGRILAAIAYTSPLLQLPTTPAGVRTGLGHIVEQAAASQVDALQQERRRIAGVRTLSWHGEQRAAQTALLAWVDARVAYLQDVARSIDALYARHPDLSVRLSAARVALLRATGDRRQRDIDRALPEPVSP